jgi:hypothetical protein
VFGEVAQLAAAMESIRTPAASDFLDQARQLLGARGLPAPGQPTVS